MTRRLPPPEDLPDPAPYLTALGRKIRSLRAGQQRTKTELARTAGVSRSFLAHIEQGRHAPNITTLLRLAHTLRTPLPDLLPDHDRPPDRPPAEPGNSSHAHQSDQELS